jgi:hypothetical protein
MTVVRLNGASKKYAPRYMRYELGKSSLLVEMYSEDVFDTETTLQVISTKGLRDVRLIIMEWFDCVDQLLSRVYLERDHIISVGLYTSHMMSFTGLGDYSRILMHWVIILLSK